MSDLINVKKSRDSFFQGKGKRKTLTSGPASVSHMMPDGTSMKGASHPMGPTRPVGPMGPAGKPKRKRITPSYMMGRKGY